MLRFLRQQVEDARRRVGEAVDVANVPVLRSQLDQATAATTAEDLWDDQQVALRRCSTQGRAAARFSAVTPRSLALFSVRGGRAKGKLCVTCLVSVQRTIVLPRGTDLLLLSGSEHEPRHCSHMEEPEHVQH